MIAAAASPITTVAQPCAHCHAGTETEDGSSGHCARVIARVITRVSVTRVRSGIAGINYGRIILRNVDNIRLGRLNLDDMISRRGKLEDVNEAFRAMKAGEVSRTVLMFE